MRAHHVRQAGMAVAVLVGIACAGEGQRQSPSPPAAQPPVLQQAPPATATGSPRPGAEKGPGPRLVADLAPTQGHGARGQVTLDMAGDVVRVSGHLRGVTPGAHGFHIHEKGDCSAPDASSAGDHFNPGQHAHGGPTSPQRHAGDLGNITAGADGKAHLSLEVRDPSLAGNVILGRAIVVHAQPDDLRTQPSGNSGARVACGVIEAAPPPRSIP